MSIIFTITGAASHYASLVIWFGFFNISTIGSEILPSILIMAVHFYNSEWNINSLFQETWSKELAVQTSEQIIQANPNSIRIVVSKKRNNEKVIEQLYENEEFNKLDLDVWIKLKNSTLRETLDKEVLMIEEKKEFERDKNI